VTENYENYDACSVRTVVTDFVKNWSFNSELENGKDADNTRIVRVYLCLARKAM
jgi:hypothetical protein